MVSTTKANVIKNSRNKSDKGSWERKHKQLKKVVSEINELVDIILEHEAKKQELVDKVSTLRSDLIKDCIHPVELCIEHNGGVTCKFCNTKLGFPVLDTDE